MSGELKQYIFDQDSSMSLAGNEVFTQAEQTQEQSRMRRVINVAVTVVGLSSVVGGAMELPAGAQSTPATVYSQALNNAKHFRNADVTDNANRFNGDAALEKASDILGHKKLDSDTAARFIFGNFARGKGALVADENSLAAIDSAIVIPSQKGVSLSPSETDGTNTSYNYINEINGALATFSSSNGGQAAERKVSKDALNVMKNDGEFNPDWAQHGNQVLLLDPIHGKNANKIIGWKPVNIVLGENGNKQTTLSGVEFKARNDADAGYPSVLVTKGGEVYIQGVEEQPTTANNTKSNTGTSANSASKSNVSKSTGGVAPNGAKVENQTGPNKGKIPVKAGPKKSPSTNVPLPAIPKTSTTSKPTTTTTTNGEVTTSKPTTTTTTNGEVTTTTTNNTVPPQNTTTTNNTVPPRNTTTTTTTQPPATKTGDPTATTVPGKGDPFVRIKSNAQINPNSQTMYLGY